MSSLLSDDDSNLECFVICFSWTQDKDSGEEKVIRSLLKSRRNKLRRGSIYFLVAHLLKLKSIFNKFMYLHCVYKHRLLKVK